MRAWRTWRPVGNADLAAVSATAAQTLADWNQAWFGLDACHVKRARIVPMRTTVVAPARTFRLGGLIGCSGSTMGLRSLVALALRGRSDPWPDESLAVNALDGFQRRLVEDLLRRLARSLGQPDGLALSESPLHDGPSRSFVLEVGMAGRESALVLDVDPAAVVTAPCRSGKAGRALTGRWEALGPSRTRLQAAIGTIRIDALELMRLKSGDVLQTESSIYEPIEVRAGVVAVGRAYPCRVEQRLALQFSLETQDGREDGNH